MALDLDNARADLELLVRQAEADEQLLKDEAEDDDEEGSEQHAEDAAIDHVEDDRAQALIDAADGRKADAEAALARLDAGTYGACIDCGKQIPDERLEFRPEAARCLEDQEKFEALNS